MTRRPHGLIYGLLALSLAVNLIGAGYLGAGYFNASETRSKGPRTVDSTIDLLAARYPKTVGDAVRARLEARRGELQDALEQVKAARRATRTAMGASPFDRDRVDAAFAASRDRSAQFQKIIHGAIVDALPGLPDAERAGVDRTEAD